MFYFIWKKTKLVKKRLINQHLMVFNLMTISQNYLLYSNKQMFSSLPCSFVLVIVQDIRIEYVDFLCLNR